MLQRILIQRASPGGISGSIFPVGEVVIKVYSVEIPMRKVSIFGNGCPSPYLSRETTTVRCVKLGDHEYIVQKLSFPADHPQADGQVTIHADNPVMFLETTK